MGSSAPPSSGFRRYNRTGTGAGGSAQIEGGVGPGLDVKDPRGDGNGRRMRRLRGRVTGNRSTGAAWPIGETRRSGPATWSSQPS